MEYHKNRREIIFKSKKILDDILSTLGAFSTGNDLNVSSINTFKSSYGKFHSELTDSIQEIVDKYKPLYSNLQAELLKDIEPIKEQVNKYKRQDTVSLTEKDPVLDFLNSRYTDENIGKPYDKERLSQLFLECDERTSKKIPPAFKDSGKTESFVYRGVTYDTKYGDFIIYKQILDYSLENDIKNVFFISNDVKKDWREPVPNYKNKYYGARKELKAEAYLKAKVENLIFLDLKEYFEISEITLSKHIFEDIDALKRFNEENKKKIISKNLNSIRSEIEEIKNKPIHIIYKELKDKKNRTYIKEFN